MTLGNALRYSLALAIACVTCAPAAGETILRPHDEVRPSIMRMHAETVGHGRALLLGDSIVEGFWWDQICEGQQINGGIGGAGVPELRKRIDTIIAGVQPAVVLLLIGVNDASRVRNVDPVEWADGYDDIVARLQQAGATLILYTILPLEQGRPLGPDYFDPMRIDAMNAHIRQVAAASGAVFRDAFDAFAREGFMPPGGTIDGVHPSRATYVALHGMIQADLTTAWARRGKPCSGF